MQEICPLPIHWHRVHMALSEAAVAADRKIPPPPTPLILSGWNFTNDVVKHERWRQTVAWAEKWGFAGIIQELTPEMMHRVEHPTAYDIGPMGGPMHLPWNYEPRPIVSNADAEHAVNLLQADWGKIAGPDLCNITRPLRLTGKKRRKLLVGVDPSATPPWGTWTALTTGPERRSFTRFRAAVNATIDPLMVDHIDFVHEERDWSRDEHS